jgi:hypothetical protein
MVETELHSMSSKMPKEGGLTRPGGVRPGVRGQGHCFPLQLSTSGYGL